MDEIESLCQSFLRKGIANDEIIRQLARGLNTLLSVGCGGGGVL